MHRWFNTAGPCRPAKNYMLPALRRLPEIARLVDNEAYFVLHAPRQVGKTTALESFAAELTASGKYVAALVSVEVGAPFRDDVGAAEAPILYSWRRAIEASLPPDLRPPPFPEAPAGQGIGAALAFWAKTAPRPLVVFIDEIDALRDTTLVSVLRQLRDGYRSRPEGFPVSLALIGLRDVRDYRVSEDGRDHLGTASPFNVKVRSLTLRNFSAEEVDELYTQHTADTGQAFEPAALARAFELTQGQPWLVNALASVVVDELVTDRSKPVTREDIDRARAVLVDRQDTHLDSLAERLRDRRIRAILEPMVEGRSPGDVPEDDRRFAVDLGLLRRNAAGTLEIANPIYREIVAKSLSGGPSDFMPAIHPAWLRSDGRLDFDQLRDSFLAFWRQHGEPMLRTSETARSPEGRTITVIRG